MCLLENQKIIPQGFRTLLRTIPKWAYTESGGENEERETSKGIEERVNKDGEK